MTSDEVAVFYTIGSCELSCYTSLYADEKAVVSTGEIANMHLWTKYRTRKAIKKLVERGMIERTSIGRPAIESCGEYRELVYDAMPPKNGYAITKKGFETEEWKNQYDMWCRSMEEWANGGLNDGTGD